MRPGCLHHDDVAATASGAPPGAWGRAGVLNALCGRAMDVQGSSDPHAEPPVVARPAAHAARPPPTPSPPAPRPWTPASRCMPSATCTPTLPKTWRGWSSWRPRGASPVGPPPAAAPHQSEPQRRRLQRRRAPGLSSRRLPLEPRRRRRQRHRQETAAATCGPCCWSRATLVTAWRRSSERGCQKGVPRERRPVVLAWGTGPAVRRGTQLLQGPAVRRGTQLLQGPAARRGTQLLQDDAAPHVCTRTHTSVAS